MTNELEKQFFDVFGIEQKQFIKDFPTREKAVAFGRKITGIPKCNKDKFEIGSYTNNIDIFQVHWKEYPQITDSILLELICILSEWRQYCDSDYIIKAINIDNLKEDILKDCLYMSNWYEFKKCGKDIKHQVRTLFEEG